MPSLSPVRAFFHPDPTQSSASLGAAPVRLLLVEDDALLRMLLAEELREAGYQVLEAGSGDEAWDLLSAGRDAADPRPVAPIHLVLTDIRMPGRLQGDELVDRLAADFPEIAVIAMSGHAVGDSAHFPHFLAKPFDIGRAIALVNRLLAPRQAGAPIDAGTRPRNPDPAGRQMAAKDTSVRETSAAATSAKDTDVQDTATPETTAQGARTQGARTQGTGTQDTGTQDTISQDTGAQGAGRRPTDEIG